jgi:hypothetical protein
MAENFFPGERSYLREAVLCVIRVHGENFLALGCAKDFDNLYQLVYAGLSWENRLSQHQFCNHTTYGPHINVGSVIWISKNEFRSSVVPRADVAYIGFAFY